MPNTAPAWIFAWRAKAMSTNSEPVLGRCGTVSGHAWALQDVAHTRALETALADRGSGLSQMQLAGLALARLTLALAPHAKCIWIACGPGNNGGDGLQAAAHLQQWGKQVVASLVHAPDSASADARAAWQAARDAGVTFSASVPTAFDACVDALFGIGPQRPLQGAYADWVACMNAAAAPTIAVDIPSGLDADTGAVADLHVVADHTLSLLTLKPGLFTGSGRDACGDIWFNDLGASSSAVPQSVLLGARARPARLHASHKGVYGDVCIVGGAPGMAGATLLAGRAALQGGAGRVFACPLGASELALDAQHPELMLRSFDDLDWSGMALVAGCGGGQAIAEYLPLILGHAKQLVLDADALNRIAESPLLQQQLAQRPTGHTVLTPHPLEAARLLATSTSSIQADRLRAAQVLAERFQCVVVLKGSGTVIASATDIPRINPTGNARLASAGTGDVLAGLLGARLANGWPALDAACDAVYRHGQAADHWPGPVLPASALCQHL
jgi:ADP-dependent NAD(P)H-hydrate dehydratase / NAD(P)H-hydrate epimerase